MGELISMEAARTRRQSDEKLLTKRQMAADIGVSPRTLDRYVERGLLPADAWTNMRVSPSGATSRRFVRSRVRAALGLPGA